MKIDSDKGFHTLYKCNDSILYETKYHKFIVTVIYEFQYEVLNQRRYSLYMEGGHRWFDMRRYNRLATLPKELATHNVFNSFPKPQAEVDWDARK